MPKVTVLIPARNAERTLEDTLCSLEKQTFTDFEVLVVNDASTDRTETIARGFDSRMQVRILTLEQNAGVAGAINRGLELAASEFVARIDADDLALPARLAMQVAFLENHPDIDVCGTAMELFYDNPGTPSRVLAKPPGDAAIKTALIQYCALSHGSAMFRRSFFEDVGKFDLRADFAEDYDLWCRGSLLGKRYANLPDVLTRYRQHADQVGQKKRQLQYERDMAIRRRYISALLGGESCGNLPEFFSLLTSFTSREISLTVVRQSMPTLFKLGRKVCDEALYYELVAGCIARHLA